MGNHFTFCETLSRKLHHLWLRLDRARTPETRNTPHRHGSRRIHVELSSVFLDPRFLPSWTGRHNHVDQQMLPQVLTLPSTDWSSRSSLTFSVFFLHPFFIGIVFKNGQLADKGNNCFLMDQFFKKFNSRRAY